MNNSYFTFIMEYKKGTYISQVYAENPIEACEIWVCNLNIDQIHGAKSTFKTELLSEILDLNLPPTAITGLQNVWCMTANVDGFVLINIIQTQT